MADVTMCQDDECPNRSECHRYCAVPSPMQSYAHFDISSGAFQCDDFIERRDGDRDWRDVEKMRQRTTVQ